MVPWVVSAEKLGASELILSDVPYFLRNLTPKKLTSWNRGTSVKATQTAKTKTSTAAACPATKSGYLLQSTQVKPAVSKNHQRTLNQFGSFIRVLLSFFRGR